MNAVTTAGTFAVVIFSISGCGASTQQVNIIDDAGTSADAKVDATPARANAPFFSVPSGSYGEELSVVIASTTPNASIQYWLHPGTSREESAKYTGPIKIRDHTVIHAITFAPDHEMSDVTEAVYVVSIPKAASPIITPPGGKFLIGCHNPPPTVTLVTPEPNGSVWFSLNPKAQPSQFEPYQAPFTLAQNAIVMALTRAPNRNDSDVAAAQFFVDIAPCQPISVSISPAQGEYNTPVTITMIASIPGTTICYTTDGNTPTCDPTKPAGSQCTGTSVEYSSTAPPVISTATTVRAIACKQGTTSSSATSSSYTFK